MGAMAITRLGAAVLMAAMAAAGQPTLPALRVEAVDAGSVIYVKNTASQPLTAYVVELVGYPGSSFTLAQDELPDAIAPGAEKRIPVRNMLIGAAPDYVKVTAAIFADGTTAGAADKAAQVVERRRAALDATREAIRRIEGARDKAAAIADLRSWMAGLAGPRRAVAEQAVAKLEGGSVPEVVAALRRTEAALAAAIR